MTGLIQKLWNDSSGATAVEYGLIISIISLAAIVAIRTVGEAIETVFTTISTGF